ncbi:endoribonuclease ZC3H12A-like isoform X1 [Neodiprion fabricii]|uniref:endoribonuclease ZC3H12A-like isoform X1 n=1 Tax=Neodiprion fabricii TaxID=2872261 RepID=UPI001ED8F945|nr:endoribonuclease ZC3H12A-like isoform X1 [Neodiprion fabricii]
MGEAPRVRVPRKNVGALKSRADSILRIFGARLSLSEEDVLLPTEAVTEGRSGATAFGRASRRDEVLVPFKIEILEPFVAGDAKRNGDPDATGSGGIPGVSSPTDHLSQIAARLQRYVDCTVLGGGNGADAEDSSYDSDYEAEDSLGSAAHPRLESQVSSSTHSDVSRTTSDTLAAEFAEYVTVQGPSPTQSPGYTARVEFALKLGYTERLVQAALQKLGPDPGQNELLAELIKLGASSPKLADTADESDLLLDAELTVDDVTQPQSPVLRPVVIDGSNVAMSHGNKEIFSCRGIKICVDWFRNRGHREITVFVPKWRKEASRPDNPIADQEILGELERDRLLVFTPSRLVGGKRMVCYDDRYILRLAAELDGIVVSNDNYRDLAQESPEFRKVVEERILMYSFVNDRFMPPDDPLGRSGPTLDNFLRIGPRRADPAPPCPYAKKCTYGNKCKFRHPERGPHPHKSVTERLVEHAQRHLQARGPSLSLPLPPSTLASGLTQHQPLCKARSAVSSVQSTSSFSSVPKSRSVENVTADGNALNPTNYPQQITGAQNPQGYPSQVGWAAPGPRVANADPEPANMHRKLQRQLTLNPACDPRLYQLRRYPQQQQPQQPHQSHQTLQQQTVMQQHRPLTRHASSETPYPVSMSWEHPEHHHQHVTRIASAPDSYRAWPPHGTNHPAAGSRAQRLGASDPQLNLLPSPPTAAPAIRASWGAQTHDARRRLHYHLANIFPEEQVQAAMALHPHETDPQQICAAILAMFPKP